MFSSTGRRQPVRKHPLDDIVGARRPAGIGITVEQFRKLCLDLPANVDGLGYSQNPRNKSGDWYEAHIASRLNDICPRLGLEFRFKTNLGRSALYLSDKVVDVVVRDTTGRELGLELKFLKGTGSLVDPK